MRSEFSVAGGVVETLELLLKNEVWPKVGLLRRLYVCVCGYGCVEIV